MSHAFSKLRLALGLALGFVVFRVGYAIIFTGASSGETLLPLSGVRLSGIFSHVVLFGSVGVNGLQNAILGALPFAAAILGFGLISALVPPSKIIQLGQRSKSGLLASLSIGLSSIPSLLDAAARISKANRMRSERKSRILIPLLETAIERAGSAAIRFALAPRKSLPQNNSVRLYNLGVDGVFSGVNLTLESGDVVVISGATGCGKSTLLESILGIQRLRSGRSVRGHVELFGLDPEQGLSQISGLVGYLPQQPRSWFMSDRSAEELLAPALDWIDFADQPIHQLSEGQVVKLATSNAVAHQPRLIVLDEPFAALDKESRKKLNQLIQGWSLAGSIVVIAEHELESIDVPNAKFFVLSDRLSPGKYAPTQQLPHRKLPVVGRELLLDYRVPKIRNLVLPPSITIHRAERIVLRGPNGIGKTSLLSRLSKDFPGARMVPERTEDFFVCQSFAEELERSDRIARAVSGLTLLTLESLIPVTEKLLTTHPRDLSAGTKLALAIAMQLAHKPQLLLVDEPVKGLDAAARERAAEVLACVAETGCAVLFATHDENFAQSADRVIELSAVRA